MQYISLSNEFIMLRVFQLFLESPIAAWYWLFRKGLIACSRPSGSGIDCPSVGVRLGLGLVLGGFLLL